MEFIFKDKQFNYIPFQEFTTDILPPRKTYQQSKFLDIGMGFDIETSRIGDEKISTMYVWQFAINEITIIGRTWDEFRDFLKMLVEFYKPTPKQRLLVWVHNLSFEWQFIKGQLKWGKKHSIFALDNRKVIKATTIDSIEFRDSLVLTQQSLEKLAKNHGLKNQKMKEDSAFDYDLPRHYETPLSESEIAYCINDVQILSEWYHKFIKKEFVQKHHQIPLTSTSIVRQDLRRRYKKVNKKEKVKYEKELQRAFPDEDMYTAMIQWLYRGGFTHANASLCDETIDAIGIDLGSYDLKSSYPASLLHYGYPREFVEKPTWWFDKYGNNAQFIEHYAYFGTFDFYNIQATTEHSIESKNKLIIADDCLFDNGRLIKGKRIRVALNEIDYLNYLDFYEWEKVECIDLYVSDKEPLPEFLKDIILKYYYFKETSTDKYIRNVVNKPRLNSVYGMMVSGLFNEDLQYNETEKVFESVPTTKSYEDIIKNEILLPQWGIWCTSYSRRALLYAFKRVGSDAIYGDTDSCKLMYATGHRWVFETYNDRMRRINANMYTGQYDKAIFRELGCFEDESAESRILKFRTLGAKRYMYDTINYDKDLNKYYIKTNVTVAGLKKGALQKYCKENGLNPYDIFRNSLKLDETTSGKLTTAYEDASFTRDFTDYLGNTVTIHEESSVTLYKIPFEMSMTQDYLDLVAELKEMNDRKLVKRRF